MGDIITTGGDDVEKLVAPALDAARDLGEHGARIEAHATDLAKHGERLDAVEGNLTGLESRVGDLATAAYSVPMAATSETVDELRSSFNELVSRVAELETKVGDVANASENIVAPPTSTHEEEPKAESRSFFHPKLHSLL